MRIAISCPYVLDIFLLFRCQRVEFAKRHYQASLDILLILHHCLWLWLLLWHLRARNAEVHLRLIKSHRELRLAYKKLESLFSIRLCEVFHNEKHAVDFLPVVGEEFVCGGVNLVVIAVLLWIRCFLAHSGNKRSLVI